MSAPESLRSSARRWMALCIGIALLAMVASALAAGSRLLQGDLARVIEERGLEPDGLFYTETHEVAEAFNYLTNSAVRAARESEASE